ncbi:UNVERIFIED_CONTAM: hypothetical protein GTU68_009260, partial [Idotea baltica]|nr:hypothetical protein [Idotea baltica]
MEQGIDMVAGDHIQLFESWYHKLDPQNSGSISADSAAKFLKKSGLNDNLLSRIWDLSDPGGKGYFDKAGLFVALKLVALVQNGGEPSLAAVNTFTPPPNMGEAPPHPAPPHPAPPHQGPSHPGPPHPPPPIAKSPGPPLVPAPPAPSSFPSVNSSGVWTITPADRGRYDQIFNSLGPEANKIHGNKVRGVMINSKLPTESLDLADMDKDGSLDRVEFSIAMHLIYKVLENNSLPVAIP